MKRKLKLLFTAGLMAIMLINATIPVSAAQQKKITDHVQAIRLIEEEFLIQSSDGTTSISQQASKLIDSQILEQIKSGSEQINKGLKSGNLIFNNITKEISKKNTVSTAGVDVYGTYLFHWYGFDFIMDAYNSGLAQIQLKAWADRLALGAAAGGVLGQIQVFIAVGAAAWLYYGYAEDCDLGRYNGNGAILYFYGDPSWGSIYHSSVR